MKFWLSKNSEVPVREQIVTQITLGIVSGDLAAGARLPSTRELALRCKVHANTVSHAYQTLAEQGWIEFRRGSGFYVRETAAPANGAKSLDRMLTEFLREALSHGYALEEIRGRMERFFEPPATARRLLVIEDDVDLRAIMIEELAPAVAAETRGIGYDELPALAGAAGAVFAAMIDEKEKVINTLPADRSCVFLHSRSAAGSMHGERRPAPEELIAVVSGWETFLLMARTMLVAVEVEPESILLRSTKEPDWQKGLRSAAMIICDSLAAKELAETSPRVRVFPLIADDSIAEVQHLLGATV